MTQKFTLNVNGKTHTVDADPDMPLLYALRDDIGLNNPRFGCGLAQCGACTVHIDGQAVPPAKPHPVQKAFVEEQAAQCGYCINGLIMTAAALLERNRKPS